MPCTPTGTPSGPSAGPWSCGEERDEGEDRARLDALERLADYARAGLRPGRGEHGLARGRRRAPARGRPFPLGTAHSRLAAALELQSRWQEGLASREQAAGAFTDAGRPAEAAAERLASATHLRSAGSLRAALSLLDTAGRQARAAGRVDLQARVLGHQGNAQARMGQGHGAVEQVRVALAQHWATAWPGRRPDLPGGWSTRGNTGDYAAAKQTYDQAFGFCTANALEPTAQLCWPA